VVFALLSGSASQVGVLFAWPSAQVLLSWRETHDAASHTGISSLEDPLLDTFNGHRMQHHNKEMQSQFSPP
jgi:hypothetical protein